MIKVAFILKLKKGFTREQVQKYYEEVHTQVPGVWEPAPVTKETVQIFSGRIVPAPCIEIDAAKSEPYLRMTELVFDDLETMKKAFASERGQNLTHDEPFNQMVEVLRIITEEY